MNEFNRLGSERSMASAQKTLSVYATGLVGLVVSVIHYAMSALAVRLEEVFAGFGAELPVLTRMLTGSSVYYWVIPLLLFAILIAHQAGLVSRSATVWSNIIGTFASMIIASVGLYLPILKVGSIV